MDFLKPTFTHQEVVAQLILSHPVIIGELSYEVVILWTKANHCLAPFSVIGAEGVKIKIKALMGSVSTKCICRL